MLRRSFFSRITAAVAALTAPIAAAPVSAADPRLTPHPRLNLDEFNSQFLGYQYAERVGDWSIFFTGYKPSMDKGFVCGQWLAWPCADLSIEERKKIGRYFYASVPKPRDCPDGYYDGEYVPGACFAITGDAELGMFSTSEGVTQLQAWVIEGRERLLRVMRKAGAI